MIDPFAPWLFTGLVLAQGLWISIKLVRTSDLALAGLAFITAVAMAIYVLGVGEWDPRATGRAMANWSGTALVGRPNAIKALQCVR
jgi:hypothetical protein